MKRIFILLLVLLLFLSAISLTACKGSSKTGDQTTDDQTTSSGNPDPARVGIDSLPKRDFGQYEFTVLYRDTEQVVNDMAYDATSSDVMEVAKYRRALAVEEYFNVKINPIVLIGDVAGDRAMNTLLAGDDIYDVILPHAHFTWGYIFSGLALEWKENLTYCNLDAPWWDQDARENFELGGNIYTMIGDFSTMTLGQTMSMVFNKKLFQELNLEYPYQMVLDGTWTFDVFHQYIQIGKADLNSDSQYELGVDRFGYITTCFGGPIGFLWATGCRTTAKDADGMPYITVKNDTTINFFDNFFNVMRTPGNLILTEGDMNEIMRQEFMASRLLMMDFTLRRMVNLTDMEDDYGIVPYPKYTPELENYASNVNAGMHLTIIPEISENPERTSLILEALSIEGYNSLTPAFYEKILQYKVSRDPLDIEMLKIIRDTRVFDFGYYTNFYTPLCLPGYALSMNPTLTFTTLYDSSIAAAQTKLYDFIDKYTYKD